MHIHAKLPMLPQHVSAPQPQAPRRAAPAESTAGTYRVEGATERKGSGQPRQDRPPQQHQNGREPTPQARRDPAAALAATLLMLDLDGQS